MEHPEAPVLFERIGGHIALVTLNRPAQRNAVNGALARLLEEYVWQIEADKTIRAGILYASSDRSFCAGADLSEVSAGRVRLKEAQGSRRQPIGSRFWQKEGQAQRIDCG